MALKLLSYRVEMRRKDDKYGITVQRVLWRQQSIILSGKPCKSRLDSDSVIKRQTKMSSILH